MLRAGSLPSTPRNRWTVKLVDCCYVLFPAGPRFTRLPTGVAHTFPTETRIVPYAATTAVTSSDVLFVDRPPTNPVNGAKTARFCFYSVSGPSNNWRETVSEVLDFVQVVCDGCTSFFSRITLSRRNTSYVRL